MELNSIFNYKDLPALETGQNILVIFIQENKTATSQRLKNFKVRALITPFSTFGQSAKQGIILAENDGCDEMPQKSESG